MEINSVEKSLEKIQNKRFGIDKNTCSIYFENIFSKITKLLTLKIQFITLRQLKLKEIDQIKKSSHL